MKKTFWNLAVALFMMTSCAEKVVIEEPSGGVNSNSSSLITFSASTGKVTRAVADNGTTELRTGFNIIALNKDDADIFIGSDDKYLWDATLNSNAGGWKWNSETADKKWPDTGYPLTFYSQFPIDAAITSAAMTSAITIKDALTEQVDMLAVKTQIDNRPLNGMANLNFNHILSNIKFSILTKNGFKVVIASIRIVKVAKTGRTYDYKAMNWTADTPSAFDGAYIFKNGTTPQEVTGSGDQSVAITPNGGSMILLPQTLETSNIWNSKGHSTVFADWQRNNSSGTPADWKTYFEGQGGARIEVIYRMEDENGKSIVGWKNGDKYPDPTDGSKEITVSSDHFVRVGYPLNLNATPWASGKRYTYVISLGTDGATNGTVLDPNFVDKDGTPTDKPVNNPDVTPGGDITYNGYIMFDVSVVGWTSGTNDDIPVK